MNEQTHGQKAHTPPTKPTESAKTDKGADEKANPTETNAALSAQAAQTEEHKVSKKGTVVKILERCECWEVDGERHPHVPGDFAEVDGAEKDRLIKAGAAEVAKAADIKAAEEAN